MIIELHIATFVLLLFATAYCAVGFMMAWAIHGAGADWIDKIRYFLFWPILEGGFKAMRLRDDEDPEQKP